MQTKVLFILKKRSQSWGDCSPYYENSFSSGLFNAANFVCRMLIKNGIEAKLVEVIDNDFIDKEVTLYKPSHVIIEALWLVPEKFHQLLPLHPTVKWIIRNHSDTPFLSNEGIGIQWMLEYLNYIPNVYISNNLKQTNIDFAALAEHGNILTKREARKQIVYLPNYYPLSKVNVSKKKHSEYIDIGCFGAIRPLKNPLLQAVASIKFAAKIGKKLRYHINGGRIESGGDSTLKSLRTLFQKIPSAQLIEHEWMPHGDFVKLCATMDIGLQVSFSETFNIVAADLVQAGTPIVTSDEVFWISKSFHADTNSAKDIQDKMERAWRYSKWIHFFGMNTHGLKRYSKESEKIWLEFLKRY